MKAYVLEGIGRLNYKDVPMPELNSGWALVKVEAAGICGSDIPRIFETGTYHFPTVPGHEFAGRWRMSATRRMGHGSAGASEYFR